ncbi:MAG TPA: hypothetical protein VF683_03535, partial [Chthoniobacterales bacterium]
MSKLCFAFFLICCTALALRAQELASTSEEPATPSIEITAAAPQLSSGSGPEPTPAPPPPPMRLSIAAARTANGKPETTYRSSAQQIVVH